MAAPDELCSTCGYVGPRCEEHHPLGRAHAPTITLWECVLECHPVLTERQRAGGVILDHDLVRSEAEQVWAWLRGTTDLFVLFATNAPRLGLEDALRDERLAVALGRLFDLIDRSVGGTGIRGPNPLGNDLRRAGRRGRRRTDWSYPDGNAPPLEADDQAGLRGRALLGTLAGGIELLPQQETPADAPALVGEIHAHLPRIERALDWLEEADREPAFKAVIARSHALQDRFIERALWVERVEDLIALAPELVALCRAADAAIGFALELAASAGPADAKRALERLLERFPS